VLSGRGYRCVVLPEPMLSRPGPIPTGAGWRGQGHVGLHARPALAVDGLWVRSRRVWNMTDLLPELRSCTDSGQPFEQSKSI